MAQTQQKPKSTAEMKLSYNSKKEWWMAKDSDHAKPPGDYSKLKVDYNHEGLFVFKIVNPQDTTFAKPAFIPKGQSNPSDFGQQFTVTGEGTDTLTVKVDNTNQNNPGNPYNGGDYHYALRFSNNTTLDPIITNGGCCSSGLQNYAFLIAAGVAVALLALWAWKVLAFRRTNAAAQSGAGDDKRAG